MSTYINNNTTAFLATTNLNRNSNNLSTDIQRLSTGLRINSAADDPAGLVISENLAAQVSGVTQATSNSNDAINEIKTAEGALNQVQSLLISIRQLAVHASNLGVNDSTDVQADQTQIASAIQSINQISATTQFGTKKLLDGSATTTGTTTSGSASLTGASAGLSLTTQGQYSAGGILAAGSLGNFVANAATATVLTSGGPTQADGANGTGGASGYYQGSVSINGNSYTVGSVGSNASIAQLNAAIASSGYTASASATGALTLTSNTTGTVASPQTASFTGLTNYSDATTTGNGAAYSAAGAGVSTGGVGVAAQVITGTAASAVAAKTTVTPASGTLANTDTVAGTFTFNGTAVTVASTGNVGTDVTNALTAAGITGYTATVNAGNLVFTANTPGQANAPIIGGLSGLTDSTGGGAVFTGSTFAYVQGASASGTSTQVTATYNGSAPYTSGTTTFGGSLSIGGANVLTGGYATAAANGTLTLAQLKAAVAANAPGYTLADSSTGAITITKTAVGATAPSFDLSGLNTYSGGLKTGNYLAANQGTAASLSATYTPAVGSPATITSASASSNGTGETYTFANGLSLSLATTPTVSQAINGTVTTTNGTTTYGQNLEYQLGANEGQTSSISIQSSAASQLGQNTGTYTDANGVTQTVSTDSIADLNVTTFKGAQDAIAVIDNAISQISTLRANLGAFQSNVLQSNVTSLGVDNTNLQASQAAVQDTDLASTVTAYTRDSILVQSATSALSYANQSPQYLLKLLQ